MNVDTDLAGSKISSTDDQNKNEPSNKKADNDNSEIRNMESNSENTQEAKTIAGEKVDHNVNKCHQETPLPDDNLNQNNTDKDLGVQEYQGSDEKITDSVLPSLGILPEVETVRNDNEREVTGAIGAIGAEKVVTPIRENTKEEPSDISHKVKKIKWQDIEVPIITQNNNGPCPLLAILNAMVLKVSNFIYYVLFLKIYCSYMIWNL